MPNLFRKNSLAPMTKDQAEEKQAVVAEAQKLVEEYEDRLKTMPRTEKLYLKKDKLLELRSKELIKLITHKSYHESDRIRKIKLFNDSLLAAFRLFDELKGLKRAIDDNDNDPSSNEAFKRSKDKWLREAARKFIPTAQDSYNETSEFAYSQLHQHDLHYAKAKDEFNMAARVIKHTAKAVIDPQNETNIATLLNDITALSRMSGSNYWKAILGITAAFVGTCMYITGEIMVLTGVMAPLGAALFAAGVGLYLAGATAAQEEFNISKTTINRATSNLNHFVAQAKKLYPQKPVIEIELQKPKDRFSVPAHSTHKTASAG